MQLARFHHAHDGWSAAFPALDSPDTLVVAFAAPSYRDRPEVLAALAAAFPASVVVGCSTSGEIDQATIVDDSVSAVAVRFEHTRLRGARTALGSAADSFAAGARLGSELRGDDLRAVFVLSEGLGVNGTELVRGLNAGLPPGVLVTGGLAGDGDRFGHTWVLAGGRAEAGTVVAVGLYGERLRVSHGSKGGWDTFGPERLVTRSEGNVLYALDDRPALALYKEYLGARAAELPASALLFPLALRAPDAAGTSIVRTVLAVDEAAQSMTFAGDIPTGHFAKLMRANFDRLVLGAQAAATEALADHDGPSLSLAISCVGRRLVLGARAEEEVEATLSELPGGSSQLGFYSYGELSPLASGRCELHNQTMTLTVLSEAP
jgi:hypothetical protein